MGGRRKRERGEEVRRKGKGLLGEKKGANEVSEKEGEGVDNRRKEI